jgi:hypothetical protein
MLKYSINYFAKEKKNQQNPNDDDDDDNGEKKIKSRQPMVLKYKFFKLFIHFLFSP